MRRLAHEKVTPDAAVRAAVRVGLVTTGLGAGLLVAPNRVDPLLGLAEPSAA